MSLTWAVSWLLLGASGTIPGTLGATLLVAACASVFAIGETLMQPTLPAIVNDLAPDELRGRYNGLTATAFQFGAICAPIAAGLLIDRDLGTTFIGVLLAGSVVVVFLSLRLEKQLTPEVNGCGARRAGARHTDVGPSGVSTACGDTNTVSPASSIR